jgi:hypothetical protein
MILILLITTTLGFIFYKFKTSKNEFFTQSKKDLEHCKKLLSLQLRNYGRSSKDIDRILRAYDYYCENPKDYDGTTVARDLFDIRYNRFKLSSSSLYHDYYWQVLRANKNLILNWKSNWLYFTDLLYNGKGAQLTRLILLSIVSVPFVVYKNLNN